MAKRRGGAVPPTPLTAKVVPLNYKSSLTIRRQGRRTVSPAKSTNSFSPATWGGIF